jgi:hypothetical protein
MKTPEGKWQVWRLCEEAGGNLVKHHSGYDDVRGGTINSALVAEFDTHQEASLFMEKDVAAFLRAFKLKDKWAVKNERIWTGRRNEIGSVRLLNVGRKWWLHYGKNHNTGVFKSRNKALRWHLQDGR